MSAPKNLTVENTSRPDQHTVTSFPVDLQKGTWEDLYVNFSGHFGSHGPHVFAAAPLLLEALIALDAMAERYRPSGYPIPDEQKLARAAIALAKGESA